MTAEPDGRSALRLRFASELADWSQTDLRRALYREDAVTGSALHLC